jgi:hypothetical protein
MLWISGVNDGSGVTFENYAPNMKLTRDDFTKFGKRIAFQAPFRSDEEIQKEMA